MTLTPPAVAKTLDRAVADLCLRYAGSHHFEGELVVPSLPELEDWFSSIDRCQRLIEEAEVDEFWRRHLSGVLKSLRTQLELDCAQPYNFINCLSRALEELITLDLRPAAERAAVVAAKLRRGHQLLGEVRLRLAERSQHTRREAIDSVRVLKVTCRQVRQALATTLSATVGQKLVDLEMACDWFASALGDLGPPAREAPLDYRRHLQEGYGLSLDWILSWCDRDLEEVKDEFVALSRRIDGGRTPQQILAEDLLVYDSSSALLDAMEEYVARARAAAEHYVVLPPGERCLVGPMPALVKQTSPWGAYCGPGVFRRELVGQVVLNEDNYRQVNQGWLQMMAVHECYPGHHTHQVKTAASYLPDSFKCGYLAADVHAEGVAHRSETLLQTLFEQAAYALFVQYRRLHTVVRIKVDLDLFVRGGDWAQATDTYQREMGMDEGSARAQARAHLLLPGAHVTYYAGMKMLSQLQADCLWDDQSFTEACFGYGFVSLTTFADLLGMSASERTVLKHWSE